MIDAMRCASILATLVVAACGDAGDPLPDAGTDAGDLAAGVRIEVTSTPAIPGSFTSSNFDPTIDDLRIQLENLRIIGDAMPEPIDIELRYGESLELIDFTSALGRYTRLRANIELFEAEGTLSLDGDLERWSIEDEPPGGVNFDLDIDVDLEPGETATVRINTDFPSVFSAVDWPNVSEDDDVLEVGEDSPEIGLVRAALSQLFVID
jgi:hypothetical protein